MDGVIKEWQHQLLRVKKFCFRLMTTSSGMTPFVEYQSVLVHQYDASQPLFHQVLPQEHQTYTFEMLLVLAHKCLLDLGEMVPGLILIKNSRKRPIKKIRLKERNVKQLITSNGAISHYHSSIKEALIENNQNNYSYLSLNSC